MVHSAEIASRRHGVHGMRNYPMRLSAELGSFTDEISRRGLKRGISAGRIAARNKEEWFVNQFVEKDVDDIVSLAVESWKLVRLFQRALMKLDAADQTRFVGQVRFFQKRVDSILEGRGIHLVTYEGQPFEPGLAASPLNADEFSQIGPQLMITQMIEPVVMGPEGVIKTGAFLLGAL